MMDGCAKDKMGNQYGHKQTTHCGAPGSGGHRPSRKTDRRGRQTCWRKTAYVKKEASLVSEEDIAVSEKTATVRQVRFHQV